MPPTLLRTNNEVTPGLDTVHITVVVVVATVVAVDKTLKKVFSILRLIDMHTHNSHIHTPATYLFYTQEWSLLTGTTVRTIGHLMDR